MIQPEEMHMVQPVMQEVQPEEVQMEQPESFGRQTDSQDKPNDASNELLMEQFVRMGDDVSMAMSVGVDMANFSSPTFGMMQIYSPARQRSLFCFNQNAAWPYNSLLDDTSQVAGGAPFFAPAPDSFASPLHGAASDPYSLPPLPPSLRYGALAHWPDHDSNLL